LTDSGEFLGTLEYVSPEQISGRELDGRSDEYSLACSAFEMLCGQPPFRREQSVSVMYAHLHEPPPPISLFRRGLPAGIDSVLGRALAKAPADRYPSCGEFASALRQVLDGKPARHGQAPADQGQRPASQRQRPAGHPATQPVLQAAAIDTQPAGRRDAPTHRFTRLAPPAYPRRARRREWWRSPAPVAGLLALVLAAGGYLLATHRPAGAAAGGHGPARPAGLQVPGCTHATASAPPLTGVVPNNIRIPGAFGVATEGQYAFVSGGGAVTVLQAGSTAGTLAIRRVISVPGANKGDALTNDGQYLLAARGSGAAVISVPNALAGAPAVVGTLTSSTGGAGAAQVVLSPDDNYAFVTLQDSDKLAVYNLQKALGSHFATSGFVGDVRVGKGPEGLAASGDSLYVANTNYLTVVSMSRAERGQAPAVVANVPAGCHGPARAQVSADRKILWVTVPGSDALLGFSTASLGSGSGTNPLVARVRVGEQPLGLALDPGSSTRIVVADSDQGKLPGRRPSLAIVDTVAGTPTVVGYIFTGGLPRQAAFMRDGRTLLVTNAGRVQVFDLGVAS
ncbi:MAG: hypothetical protein J2P28_16585, partial [Actinobacteria bacterium]|nr:hypothetical protein [Actinomycetota bacterium]